MNAADLLRDFFYGRMTLEQYKEAINVFGDEDRLLWYICLAYNTYEVLYSVGAMQLITNPDAIFISKVEMTEFLEEFKDFVKTMINEDEENGASTSNRTN